MKNKLIFKYEIKTIIINLILNNNKFKIYIYKILKKNLKKLKSFRKIKSKTYSKTFLTK